MLVVSVGNTSVEVSVDLVVTAVVTWIVLDADSTELATVLLVATSVFVVAVVTGVTDEVDGNVFDSGRPKCKGEKKGVYNFLFKIYFKKPIFQLN